MTLFLNVYTISIFVALVGVLFGFEIASMSVIVGTRQYKEFFNNPLGIQQGLITTCGSFVGSISSSFLAERLSRKLTIQLGAIVWCIGTCLQSAAYGVVMLIIGRAIAGLCIGITSTVVEIARRKIRGRVVSLQNCALGFGLLVQYFIQYGCSFINSTVAFRVPWAIQTIPAIILFIVLFWLPRSPRWLASRYHWDEALEVLAFLRTANRDINNPLVLAEYKEIEGQIYAERESNSNSYRKLVGKRDGKRLMISMVIQAFTQICGVNFLMYFTVNILQSVGRPNSLLTSSILYVMGLLATNPVMIWTDRWGRRSSLLLVAICMAFWMYLAGGLFATFGEKNPAANEPYTWIIDLMYLCVLSYALSWGPVSWIYPPEIMPQLVRAKGVALATATKWAFNAAMVAFVFAWLLVPETKQRTLEEMDGVFGHGEPLWRSFGKGANCDRLDILAREIELTRGLHPRN
ncbi:general substrate transporter [Lipomyces tetrasporus]